LAGVTGLEVVFEMAVLLFWRDKLQVVDDALPMFYLVRVGTGIEG